MKTKKVTITVELLIDDKLKNVEKQTDQFCENILDLVLNENIGASFITAEIKKL